MSTHHITLAILATFLWGVSFPISKICLAEFPPFLLLTLRMFGIAIILSPLALKNFIPIKKGLLIAFFLAVVHFGCMFISLYMDLPAAVFSVLDLLRVPFGVALAILFLKENISLTFIIGISIALIGTAFLINFDFNSYDAISMLVAFGSALGWGLYNVFLKKLDIQSSLNTLAWIAILSLPQLAIISAFGESHLWNITDISANAWLGLAYIVIFGTIIAHGVWFYLLIDNPLSTVAPYSLLVSVFGFLASSMILSEPIQPNIIMGGIVVLIGVSLVTYDRRRLC